MIIYPLNLLEVVRKSLKYFFTGLVYVLMSPLLLLGVLIVFVSWIFEYEDGSGDSQERNNV